ncbi:MAG: hypothetical protein H7343_21150 [Undibacterium sp.]|nr:hypothetical protein [Opitutaceae bacterium]
MVALIGGAVVFVYQQRTIAELREADARTKREVAMLATESAENVKARAEAEKEATKLRLEAVTLKVAGHDRVQAPRERVVAALPAGETSPTRVVIDTAAVENKKAQMHRRYDAFFQQRGLTPEQTERMIELKLQQAEASEDLQAAVETAGLRGDTKGIEAMRSKLYEPITNEVREILGADGYAAYRNYETTSFYRAAFVEPMSDMFAVANAPLSSEQAGQLVRALDANKQLRKVKPTNIGSEITMDWEAVIGQMSGALTPAQVNVIRVYADRQKTNKR